MKTNEWFVCIWDDYGQFWKRLERFVGHHAKEDAENLARFWGAGYAVKSAKNSVRTT